MRTYSELGAKGPSSPHKPETVEYFERKRAARLAEMRQTAPASNAVRTWLDIAGPAEGPYQTKYYFLATPQELLDLDVETFLGLHNVFLSKTFGEGGTYGVYCERVGAEWNVTNILKLA